MCVCREVFRPAWIVLGILLVPACAWGLLAGRWEAAIAIIAAAGLGRAALWAGMHL